ncbi:Imm10 family immunity protein [Enterobacter sp. A8]|uniref:Imm10 family immunity protein n=1 Tax=Enterobacter sp. A8 TaxID=2507249 RepID=UPI00102F2127|nr:Imm10 family immunity protein [Enterobacter sp. A8]
MSIIKNLVATCINCAEENDVLTIGIGDDSHDPKNFIIIGRFDEDELSVNECICFQSESTEYELTDSIRSVQLIEDKLVIVLNEDAVKMIGIREYHVVIPAAKDSKSLGKCLWEVFEGSDVPLELS